jgi:hypothetical protein
MTSSSNPARSSSPSNSFYALSDDEEGEYNTITSTTSGRGVKLLFSKSKASPYAGQQIEEDDAGTYETTILTLLTRFTYILRRLRKTIYQAI